MILLLLIVNWLTKTKYESISCCHLDKDLMQLVTKNITMLDPMKNKKIGIRSSN